MHIRARMHMHTHNSNNRILTLGLTAEVLANVMVCLAWYKLPEIDRVLLQVCVCVYVCVCVSVSRCEATFLKSSLCRVLI